MAKPEGLGKAESFFFGYLGLNCRAGQGVAIVQPADEIAVAAAGRTERRMIGLAGLAANRAKCASRTG